ncbi:hypothetical protein ACFL0G_01585 [Candidatus Zixiibacteriota bacterium]
MKSRFLTNKLRKLERQAGLGSSLEIPRNLNTVFFYDLEEGQAPEEVNGKIDRRKSKLVEKYGRRVLKRLHFIVLEDVSSNRSKPSLAV